MKSYRPPIPSPKPPESTLPKTCGQCHSQPAPGMADMPAVSYQESVHGRLVAAGNTQAAVCSDCHGNHDIRGPSDPASPFSAPTSPPPAVCATALCRQSLPIAFTARRWPLGNDHAPVCTSCHGVHTNTAVGNSASMVSSLNQGNLACGQCHNNVRMTQDFGIPGGRLSTYRFSYHGMANAEGSTRTAICSSCHGSHEILPASDPRSTINPANLAKTCGQCHPGANANFAKGKIHLDPAAAAQADFGDKVVTGCASSTS